MNRIKSLQTIAIILLVICIVAFPREVFEAAVSALDAWWRFVFPALLPFLIGSQLLLASGLVHFMSILLEPVMRPLFNLPGSASFVMAIGYTSGFPISSMITAQLRQDGLCTRTEGERLLAFTNNASPLFMLAAVAVGMYNNPRLGLVIAGAHYLANLTVGLLLRWAGPRDTKSSTASFNRNLVRRAFRTLRDKQSEDKRPIGKVLGDVVNKSIDTVCLIAGFMVLFAIIIRLCTIFGIMSALTTILAFVLRPLGIAASSLSPLVTGFFEITLGAQAISKSGLPLTIQLGFIAVILAWSGFSVHAQVAAMIGHTDLRMGFFTLARLAQGFFSVVYTLIFMGPLHHIFFGPAPVFAPSHIGHSMPGFITTLFYSTTLFAGLTTLGAFLLILLLLQQGASLIIWHLRK